MSYELAQLLKRYPVRWNLEQGVGVMETDLTDTEAQMLTPVFRDLGYQLEYSVDYFAYKLTPMDVWTTRWQAEQAAHEVT